MDPNVPGDNSWPGEPGSYWRRRFFALAAGLAVLGLLAWACSGALGGQKPPPQAPGIPTQAAAQQAAVQASTQANSQASAQAATSSGQSALPSGTTGGSHPGHGSHATSQTAAAVWRHTVKSCAPRAIVISLHASQHLYQRRAEPRFTIAVVNASRSPCTSDLGRRALRLVIKSGSARIWGSADCARTAARHMVRLARGVPFTANIVWNRRSSSPGCRSVGPRASPGRWASRGTYMATVPGPTRHSAAVAFVLR
jgi:hypothetical protein